MQEVAVSITPASIVLFVGPADTSSNTDPRVSANPWDSWGACVSPFMMHDSLTELFARLLDESQRSRQQHSRRRHSALARPRIARVRGAVELCTLHHQQEDKKARNATGRGHRPHESAAEATELGEPVSPNGHPESVHAQAGTLRKCERQSCVGLRGPIMRTPRAVPRARKPTTRGGRG